jgi:hypothetical protein
MSGLTLSAKVQDAFFDRQAVIEQVGRANARRLSRAGAFIRRRVRTDILRRRKGTSSPGSPPHVHSRDNFATLRNVQFALNRTDESLLVGPIRINSAKKRLRAGVTTVPELLEYGGRAPVEEMRDEPTPMNPDPEWRLARGFVGTRLGVDRRTRTAEYAARPFMGPAFRKEVAAGTIGSLFAYGGAS